MSANDWECPHCGSGDPHNEIRLSERLSVDVTCRTVYIQHAAIDDMIAMTHKQFEQLIYEYGQEYLQDRKV